MYKTAQTPYGKFTYFPVDCIGDIIQSGAFWDACLRVYMDKLEPGDVFIDVGANIGFFPVYLAQRGVVCHAFEASPELAHVLKHNTIENNVQELITVYNVALYDSETTLVLHRDWRHWTAVTDGKIDYFRTGNSGWLCLVPEKIGDSYAKFQAKTLDSFEIKDVKLIKIDTQGCDLRILHGSRKTIEAYHPVILFEYEGFVSVEHGDSFNKYESFFKELGYTIQKIGDVEYVAIYG